MRYNILIILLLTVGSILAQGPPPQGMGGPQNMDAVRIWKLTEILELTEEQIVTFLPLVQVHERKLRAVQREIQDLMVEGRKLLEQENISQKEVDKMIKRYSNKYDQIYKIKQDFIKTLPKHLNPEQQLLYMGFEARFRKELRSYMKDRRGFRKPNRLDERP